MFAVIELPDFPLQALLRLRPLLRQEPVGLLLGEGRRAVITHVNALAEGIRPGMTAAQALAECPALQLVSPFLDAEREADAILLTAGWSLSPRVELSAPGRCTIDLAGCNRDTLPSRLNAVLKNLDRQELPARIGIGATPLVARFAAHVARPVQWVEDARGFLAPLPVSLLDLTPDEAGLFADLGLRTLGSITAFPRAALANRLGARGDVLWARAAGEWPAPIQPAPFPVRYVASLELEEAVETLEPLLFVLRRFCDRLAGEVGQFGGGTNRLSLVLTLDDESTHSRDFDLPEPTANPETLFAVLVNHLSALQTDAPIVALELEAFPARRLEQQEGLFDTGLKDAPMFYATLGRLCAVVGRENVGTPRRLDSHRADALSLVAPAATVPERQWPSAPEAHGPLLRRLRPAVPATVELTEAKPSYLASGVVAGGVTVLRRPFRANGEWWSPESWAREEWDVQIGTDLYRLLHLPEGWFVEGIYD
jgi:protein ImuB